MFRTLLIFILASTACAYGQEGAMEGIDAFFAEDGFFDNVDDALQKPDSTLYLDLSLQSPKLTAIPTQVFQLVNLKYLELGFNQIGIISPEIEHLQQLEVLGLDGNRYLNSIPEVVLALPFLKELHLKDTGLSSEELNRIRARLPSSCIILN